MILLWLLCCCCCCWFLLLLLLYFQLADTLPCASSEDFGAANQDIQHEVKPRANYTPVLPEGRCVNPRCGTAEPPHFPKVGRPQKEKPLVSSTGFGAMPRGGLGQGCLPMHTTGMLVPMSEFLRGKCSLKSDVNHLRKCPAQSVMPPWTSLYKNGREGAGW